MSPVILSTPVGDIHRFSFRPWRSFRFSLVYIHRVKTQHRKHLNTESCLWCTPAHCVVKWSSVCFFSYFLLSDVVSFSQNSMQRTGSSSPLEIPRMHCKEHDASSGSVTGSKLTSASLRSPQQRKHSWTYRRSCNVSQCFKLWRQNHRVAALGGKKSFFKSRTMDSVCVCSAPWVTSSIFRIKSQMCSRMVLRDPEECSCQFIIWCLLWPSLGVLSFRYVIKQMRSAECIFLWKAAKLRFRDEVRSLKRSCSRVEVFQVSGWAGRSRTGCSAELWWPSG